jgi:hypothetical protein
VAGAFLPPEPAGPDPEIGGRPAAPQPPPAYGQPPPAYGQPPPAYGQPPPAYGQPPPGYSQPPPGYAPWAYTPPQPDNNPAIVGFIFSLVGIALLLFTVGLSSIVSLGCSITAVVAGRKGIKRVDAGATPKHRGFAQAGFWVGVAGVLLALVATAIWVIVAVAAATDEEFRDELDREFDDSRTISLVLPALVRAVALLSG